jgi:cation transport regulator ChaB
MPYSYPDHIPDRIKGLPVGAQKIFIATFNSALSMYKDEKTANQVAWDAVNDKYEQDKDGKWRKK